MERCKVLWSPVVYCGSTPSSSWCGKWWIWGRDRKVYTSYSIYLGEVSVGVQSPAAICWVWVWSFEVTSPKAEELKEDLIQNPNKFSVPIWRLGIYCHIGTGSRLGWTLECKNRSYTSVCWSDSIKASFPRIISSIILMTNCLLFCAVRRLGQRPSLESERLGEEKLRSRLREWGGKP